MAQRRNKPSKPPSNRRKTGPTPSRRQSYVNRNPDGDTAVAAKAITEAVLALARRDDTPPPAPMPNELHITIATGAGGALTLDTEDRLVRAALLYADKVTLLSPGAYLLVAAHRLRRATDLELIEIIRRVGPYLPDFDPAILRMDPRLLAALFSAHDQSEKTRDELIAVVDGLTDTPAMRSIQQAEAAGLLHVESLARRPADRRHLEAIREHLDPDTWSDGEGIDGAAEVLMARLAGLLSSGGRSLPLLDDQVGDLARSAVAEGMFVPAPSAGSRTAHAGTAAGFIERLPTFPAAPMDAILDVRRELEAPLVRFRSEVIRLSGKIENEDLQADLAADVDREWHAAVRPALQELEEAVAHNKYLRQLGRAFTEPDRVNNLVLGGGAGGMIGVAMGSVSASAFALAAASTGLGAALDVRKARRAAGEEHTRNSFWFLHQADARLGE
jgi:hypothetical protein